MAMRPWFTWRRDRPVDDEAPVLDALLAEAARLLEFSLPAAGLRGQRGAG
jgi:hypothetical protein